MMKKKREPCDCPKEILDLLSQGRYDEAMKNYGNMKRKRGDKK